MNCVSAHQLPLARAVAGCVGERNFRYVDAGLGGQKLQTVAATEAWITDMRQPGVAEMLREAEMVLTGVRDAELIAARLRKGLETCYYSERWFKPIPVFGERIWLPGWVKLLHPRYLRMARSFARFARSEHFHYLPIGPAAASDMRLILRLFNGFGGFAAKPANPFLPWGYFVERGCRQERPVHSPLRVLSVCRLLRLKHVETVIEAVARVNGSWRKNASGQQVCLTIVGDGPESARLKALAARMEAKTASASAAMYTFVPPVPMDEVRRIMREHDVLVFSSNAFDGWGAVVSEALEEGMRVVGTYETGAAATMLPDKCLFHCGDVKALSKLLAGEIPYVGIGEWCCFKAADRLLRNVNFQKLNCGVN